MSIPRPPTKRSISALLARAGFASAGRFGMGAGFYVYQGAYGDEVTVSHHGDDSGPRDDAADRARLDAYAKALRAAGWAVEAGEWDLVVTASKTEG